MKNGRGSDPALRPLRRNPNVLRETRQATGSGKEIKEVPGDSGDIPDYFSASSLTASLRDVGSEGSLNPNAQTALRDGTEGPLAQVSFWKGDRWNRDAA